MYRTPEPGPRPEHVALARALGGCVGAGCSGAKEDVDGEKRLELTRLHNETQEAADALHAQAEEVYEMTEEPEELTKDTGVRYAGMRARVEASATWNQAADLCRALEGMPKKTRGKT